MLYKDMAVRLPEETIDAVKAEVVNLNNEQSEQIASFSTVVNDALISWLAL